MAMVVETRFGGFLKYDPEHLFLWEMLYDENGNYVSQNQEDVTEGGLLNFKAEMIDGVPCVDGKPVAPLTSEEMEEAKRKDEERRTVA